VTPRLWQSITEYRGRWKWSARSFAYGDPVPYEVHATAPTREAAEAALFEWMRRFG
jgi:hypothetical protein